MPITQLLSLDLEKLTDPIIYSLDTTLFRFKTLKYLECCLKIVETLLLIKIIITE